MAVWVAAGVIPIALGVALRLGGAWLRGFVLWHEFEGVFLALILFTLALVLAFAGTGGVLAAAMLLAASCVLALVIENPRNLGWVVFWFLPLFITPLVACGTLAGVGLRRAVRLTASRVQGR